MRFGKVIDGADMASDETKIKEESVSVQVHLGITQSVIQRMASNCGSCKAWCITLVSAILVIVADKEKPQYALIAFIPTVLFLVLDTYYLALERCFRQAYNEFIEKLHSKQVIAADLYAIMPRGSLLRTFIVSMLSFSIWPFYLLLVMMIFLTEWLIFCG